jgi:hypothetical protein
VDAEAFGAHHGENAHRFPENLLLIGDPQDAECAVGVGSAPESRDRDGTCYGSSEAGSITVMLA